jgi:flagellar basal-body rod protein FlgF
MGSGIYIATSGAVAQDSALDVTANNIANASTAGYKAQRVSFGEALANTQSRDAAFTGLAGMTTDGASGALRQTGNPLDMALVGDGYFAVNTPAGVRYTRAGDFRLDGEGRLVNGDGLIARAAGGGELRIPPDATNLTVERDGQILSGEDAVGQLELARFDPTALRREGDNLYAAIGPAKVGASVEVESGAIEQSNVNVVRGMVDLVKVSRTYESLMRMIQGYRDMENAAARGIGRPR